MIPAELAKKIRYIEIFTSKAVNDSLAGEYHSVFKGRGMEFDEVRLYQFGDEIRSIDWNVTARMGEPYVKRFVEERELTVFFLVDLSASGDFGSRLKKKNEVSAELSALLSFSAIKNNDRVGLIVFTDQIEMFIPPAKGTTHVLRLIHELLGFEPKQAKTDISAGIDYLGRVTSKRCVVFLISDFIAEGFEQKLRVIGKRHDLIAVSIMDPRELKMPDIGMVELEDAETGKRRLMDTGSRMVKERYERLGSMRRQHLKDLFRSMDIDQIEIITTDDYIFDLIRFFRTRGKKTA